MPAEWNNGEIANVFFSNPSETSQDFPAGHPARFLSSLKRLLKLLPFFSVSFDFDSNVCYPYPLQWRPFSEEKISACIVIKWFCLFFHRVEVFWQSAWCVMANEISLTVPTVICTRGCHPAWNLGLEKCLRVSRGEGFPGDRLILRRTNLTNQILLSPLRNVIKHFLRELAMIMGEFLKNFSIFVSIFKGVEYK